MMKFVILATMLVAASAASANYTCSVDPGSSMDVHSCTLDGTAKPGDTVTLKLEGTVDKVILAGSFAFKIYEDSVQHFVAQGNVEYFECTNKGCDPHKPVSLTLTPTGHSPANFTAAIPFKVPKPEKTGAYHIVFQGQDQDHYPYDVTGTVALEGTCTSDADCPANSYCQDGPGHIPPFNCHST